MENNNRRKIEIEKGIFIPAAAILMAVVLIGFLMPPFFHTAMKVLFDVTTKGFGWFYLLMSAFLVFLCFGVAISPCGNKVLGGPDAKPEHRVFSWCAMTICSGIATAVVFYAVGEPLTYYHIPPAATGLASETPAAAVRGVQIAAFHWGFVYYGIFTFWGLVTGYMSMNHNLPARPSSALYPFLKDKIYGPIGKAVDVVSLLALVGGIVTSLGFGTTQFASGLQFVFGMKPSNLMYVATIVVVTLSYTVSSGRGIKKGMKIISDTNAYVYIALLIFLFAFGPTVYLLNLLTDVVGSTIMNYIPTALNADAFDVGEGWSRMNTVFFMAWIMAYAPLIGLFLAKISRGRTVRQFLLVNILAPGTFVILWFVGFGGNAIYVDHYLGGTIFDTVQALGFPVANFALLNEMPLSAVTNPMVIAALFLSFITLADAMTGTIASMTVKNTLADEAPVSIKFFWGILIGATTVLCLFALGEIGTTALQNMSIVYALPIFIITIPAVGTAIKMASGSLDREMEELAAKAALEKKEEPPVEIIPEAGEPAVIMGAAAVQEIPPVS